MKKIRVRKGRNPRYTEALNIASENNKLLKEIKFKSDKIRKDTQK